jgi:hypothetical protein
MQKVRKSNTILDKFQLLRKKQTRNEIGEYTIRPIHKEGNDEKLQKFKTNLFNLPNNSFKINIPKCFQTMTRNNIANHQHEKMVILKILKSNAPLTMINTTFVIKENGLELSQKTHGQNYISIGRQQINEQGIRPNDIMLFPTDPSISRSHFKIYYKSYFNSLKEVKEGSELLIKYILSKSCQKINNFYKNILTSDICNILKYLKPVKRLMIEDNSTIYGTYVKVREFTLQRFLLVYYVMLKNKIVDIKYSPTKEYPCSCKNVVKILFDMKHNKPNQIFWLRKELLLNKYLSIMDNEKCLYKYLSENYKLSKYQSDYEILNKNCKILTENSVFLVNSKSGFIISCIGSINKVVEAVKIEYQESQMNDAFVPFIELISLIRVFDEQKFDPCSRNFKMIITKEQFLALFSNEIYQLNSLYLNNFSFLYFIETSGDPCGIMNRTNEIIFISSRSPNFQGNSQSINFSGIVGYLIGNNEHSSYLMNIESDIFLSYYPFSDAWLMWDLTMFLSQEVYDSTTYHFIWECISKDKRNTNRFTPVFYPIKNKDEIKVSETIMSIKFGEKN